MSLMGAYSALLHLLIGTGVLVFAVAEERPEHALLSVPVVIFAYALRRSNPGFGAPTWALNLTLIGITVWSLSTATWAIDQTVAELSRYITFIQLIRLFEKPTSRKWAQEIGLSAMLVLGAALTNVALIVGVLIFAYSAILLVTVLAHQVCVGAWRDAVRGDRPVVTGNCTSRMRRDFARVCTTAAVIVVVCSVVAFVLMPRGLGQDMIFGARLQQVSSAETRFSDAVTLGEQGLISESSKLVMKVQIVGMDGKPPHLFRGTTLDSYDPRTSRWTRSRSMSGGSSLSTTRTLTDELWSDPREGAAVTRVRIVRSEAPYFFALAGASDLATPRSQSYYRNSSDGTLRYDRQSLEQSSEYAVLSDLQSALTPSVGGPLDAELEIPFTGTGVRRIALAILDSAGIEIDASDPAFRTRAVDAFTEHMSVGFSYTLNQISPPVGVDPLTHFLEETREGHCEYFASSLAALCRSVGIDSRVVTGYVMIEEEVKDSGLYSVRESHAHAWTEVEIAPGEWREFDPSPQDGVATQHRQAQGLVATYRRMMDSVQIAWSKYVVNFDEKSQAAAIGNSLGGSGNGYEALGENIEQFNRMPTVRKTRLMMRAVATGLLVFVGSFTFFTLVRFIARRLGFSRWRGKTSATIMKNTEAGRVYGAMLGALAKAGMGKPEWRTPVSHAATLEPTDADLAHSTREIAMLYYRAAFGGRALTDAETARAGAELTNLRGRLRELKRRGAHRDER